MTIGEFYKKVGNIPKMINIIKEEDDSHPWMGDIKNAPQEVLDIEFKYSYIYYNCSIPQIIFYI